MAAWEVEHAPVMRLGRGFVQPKSGPANGSQLRCGNLAEAEAEREPAG